MRTAICSTILLTAAVVVVVMSIHNHDEDASHDNEWAVGYHCIHDGRAYRISISKGDLRKSPPWKEHGSPPVSPGRALELARVKLESTVPDAKDWKLRMICLQPTPLIANRWIYAVNFNPPPGPIGFTTGPAKWLTVAVLMDETVPLIEVEPGIMEPMAVRNFRGSSAPTEKLDEGADHDNDWAMKFQCIDEGRAYKTTVSIGNLRKSPPWKENGPPPVSPGRALELARMKLESTVPEAKDWELRLICMQPTLIVDKWTYAIEFNPPLGPSGFSTGPANWLTVVILLDETVVPVDVQEYKPGITEPMGVQSIRRPPSPTEKNK